MIFGRGLLSAKSGHSQNVLCKNYAGKFWSNLYPLEE
jgi:hypothetical protein